MTGFIYICLMLFMGLAAISTQANLLFGVFGLMFGVIAVAYVIGWLVLRRLNVRREIPEHMTVGVASILTYEMTNRKRYWPSFSVTLRELDSVDAFLNQPQAYMLHAAPRTNAMVPGEVVPVRRGLHRLDRFQLCTSFPFGFIKRAWDQRIRDSVLVFPAIAEVDRKLLSLMRSAESSGTTIRPRRGGSDEFYGLKEYRQGENPRFIYWRRSARTGTLVLREMTKVSPPKLLILVDTQNPDGSTERAERIERCIAIGASLASRALDDGLSAGLVARSVHWIRISPNRGKRQRREVLSALACLEPNASHDLRSLQEAATDLLRSDTTQVIISPDPIGVSLSDAAAGATFPISLDDPRVNRWFRFDPSISFPPGAVAGPIGGA